MTTAGTAHNASTTASSDIARRFVDDILNHGRFDVMAEIVHPEYRYEGPDGTQLQGLRDLELLIAGFEHRIRSIAPEIEPRAVGRFAGVLDYARLSPVNRAVFRALLTWRGADAGDHRNWGQIRSWALGLASVDLADASEGAENL